MDDDKKGRLQTATATAPRSLGEDTTLLGVRVYNTRSRNTTRTQHDPTRTTAAGRSRCS